MALQYAIPKTSTYLSTRNEFTAAFNVPTLGLYDFNTAANVRRPVLTLNTNAIYLINRIAIGGTIPLEEYLFNIVTLPLMFLEFTIENQRVYALQLPIVQFYDGLEAVSWFWTDKGGEELSMTLKTGQLSQDPFLVGTASVKINVSLSIFEINDNGFIQSFKNDDRSTKIGQSTHLQASNKFFINEGEFK